MNVQLFNPPVHHYNGLHYRMNPPLSLPIMAAVLNQAGHHCEVVDLEALSVYPEQFVGAFAKQTDRWPDWIGFTALSSSARGAEDCIRGLRTAGYEGQIVVGGVLATLSPRTPLEWGADLVVTGECEGNLIDLLEAGTRGIVKGQRASIESIPAPDWGCHNPPPTSYSGNHPMLSSPQSISMFSRGCPGDCTFCGNVIFAPQRIRYRPPGNIQAEWQDLDSRHVRSVFVYDDELVGQAKHPQGWLAEIADRIGSLDITWKCQGRCSEKHVTLDLMRDLYRGGCRIVMWGVESFSPKVLRDMKKHTTPDDIWHTLRTAKQAGLKNWVFTMIGNYGETEEDLAVTAQALGKAYDENLIDYRQTTIVTALPGTELMNRQVAEGWYQPSPESGPQMAQIFQSTPWLTADQMRYWLHAFDSACPASAYGRAVAA